MHHAPHARCGGVLLLGAKHWLLWDAERPRPLCFPIISRRQPLTRWDLPINANIPGLRGNAIMASPRRGREIETAGAVIVAQLDARVVEQMVFRLRRAAESEAIEARYQLQG